MKAVSFVELIKQVECINDLVLSDITTCGNYQLL